MTLWRPSVFGGAFAGFAVDQFGTVKVRQLEPPVSIRGPHHDDVDPDPFETVDPVHPRALDRHLAFARHPELAEKRDRGRKVVDHDADVVQSLEDSCPQ
jgi:hypothetical protein